MPRALRAEICVIGGGPAGATAARRLSLLGHQVLLVEREPFPRRHIGESLAPGILPLLDFLGLREDVEKAGFLRPHDSVVYWGGAERRETTRPGEPGFQADRGRFDLLLLNAAAAAGVRVLQPARARPPERGPEGRWRVPVRSREGDFEIDAGFLVDASGRRSVVGRSGRRDAVPTLALFAYWRDAGVEDAATRVEAGRDEWYWGAPLPDRTFNATVFIDPRRGVSEAARDLPELYRGLLAKSRLLRGCLAGRPVTDVVACDASSRHARRPVGEGFVQVGEASFTIDPLSSQGVQTAVLSALQASVVVHTALRRPEDADLAFAFYRERQTESVEQNRTTASRFYGEQAAVSPTPFWLSRSPRRPADRTEPAGEHLPLPKTCRVVLAPEVELIETPVIRGDFVERARGLSHPSLARPIAFLGDAPVGPVVDAFASPTTAELAASELSRTLPAGQVWRTLSWLWSRRWIRKR